ncbi:hypothetical protein PI124_g20759 [Phytophthora idaei]|nr:hypothetical protein PI125_g22216 [Phytophthora idaei]KAG3130556.1 hypothetical protein PI126_g20451 [Phytophthora idaei]KAG3234186.1 hypothetical protein PI124_g20759 [Phytophthora idaei]
MPRYFLGNIDATEELMAEVDAKLREQADAESTNVIVSVRASREFAKETEHLPAVFLAGITCVLSAERLANNKGTPITLVDGFMQPHWKAYSKKLAKMDPFRRDARVLKITVWDRKLRSTGRPRFEVWCCL